MLRALTVSLLATALIGGLLYYTFKRSDLLYGQQREAQASQAAQQEAMAGAWRSGSLADAMVIDNGNRVFAASNAAYVGQQIQDANWTAVRAQNREVLIRDEPAPGQERITVIEPILDKGSTIAWARLTFVRPLHQDAGRATRERLEQVGRILVPVFVFLVAAIGIAMRLATSRLQQRIQTVVAEAMTGTPASRDDEGSREDGGARPGGGSRRAA